MISEKKYWELITKTSPLTQEEQAQIEDFEKLIFYGKKYQEEITSQDVSQIEENYDREMIWLATLKEEEKNPNMKTALQSNQKMTDNLQRMEQAKQQENEKALRLEKKLDNRFATRAGFTNASIILFLVLLLGILLSVGLLSIA